MIERVHHIEGRTRYRIDGLAQSPALKDWLESGLSERPEVIRASASLLTGKLLVCYNSGSAPEVVSDAIEAVLMEYQRGCRQTNRTEDSAGAEQARDSREEPPGTADQAPAPPPAHTGRIHRRLKTLFAAEEQTAHPWHRMPAADVLKQMAVSGDTGLDPDTVKERLQRFGPNRLPEMERPSQFSMFAQQFKTLPVGLLAIAAGLSIGTGGLLDAALIMGVVTLNAAIGYATESKAEKTISSLRTLVKPSTRVLRAGKESTISAEQVVPGDILVLKPGTFVTADSRVISATHLSVDESALTGESMPVSKHAAVLDADKVPLADHANMVFMGTLVTGGQALAVAVATGGYTEIGRLQQMVGEAKTPQTPLEKQLNHVGNQLVLVSSGICGLFFVIGLIRGYSLLHMMRTAISLAAAAVPEGLPAVATTTLAFGMNSLRRQHVLIRRLGAVETLGSVQIICLDKTGTLTLNEMSVMSLYAGMKTIEVHDKQFTFCGESFDPSECEELRRLMEISVLCSDTRLAADNGPSSGDGDFEKPALKGSPTENALVLMAINAGLDVKTLRKAHPLLEVTHRSENRLFMNTLHESPDGSRLVALKGSPAEVIEMCRCQLIDGEEKPLTDEDREAIQRENERMAGKALRVLGMAYAVRNSSEAMAHNDFTWLGLAGMADPIREGVTQLIGAFHRAGIKTVMLTGDQSPTAFAVAKALNLSEGSQVQILESSYLEEMAPETLEALVQRVHVFARISPSHKLQIVQALQKAGQVIAMTGDGINDTPALKSADIGIAMGEGGTDIAREVADVVLEADDLDTLVAAIAGGRSIYENIRKSVHFLTATNLSEIIVTFACIAGGLGQPLNAMQLLWINTISDIFPALALSMAPAEPGIMDQPPRDPQERIIRSQDLKRMARESAVISAGALGAYGYGLMRYGMGPRTSTLVFQGLTLAQLLHTMSCRSEKQTIFDPAALPTSRYLYWALGGSVALQALSMLVPGLRRLLGITPLSLLDGAVIGGSAVLPFIVNEGTKKFVYAHGPATEQEVDS